VDIREAYATPAAWAGMLAFLLTDVEGSTRRWRDDPDSMRVALQEHDALMSTVIRDNGGVVLTER